LQRLLAVAVDTGSYEAGGRHDIQDGECGKKRQHYGRVDQLSPSRTQRLKGFLDRYYSSRPSRRRIAGFDPLPTLATGCFAPFEPAALELLLRGDPPCPEPSAHHYTSRDQAH
jgi:hypothetical protein